jgi:outer membrane protein W
MNTKTAVALLMLTAAAPLHVAGQSLADRHLLELRVGAWNQLTDSRTEVGASGVATSVGATGFIGGITYAQWLREDLAWRIGIGAMAASVDTDVGASGVTTKVAIVSPLLVGLRYYLSGPTPTSAARPFVGGSVGAFIGSQASTATGAVITVEERTESAMGFEGSAGVDILMGGHFLLSVVLAYDGMTDFDRPIGGSMNYSGPQFRLGFGWVFGGGSA